MHRCFSFERSLLAGDTDGVQQDCDGSAVNYIEQAPAVVLRIIAGLESRLSSYPFLDQTHQSLRIEWLGHKAARTMREDCVPGFFLTVR